MAKFSKESKKTGGAAKSGTNRNFEVECEHCALNTLCELLGYGEGDIDLPEGTLLRKQPVSKGEAIFRTGDPFRSFFAVKSGSFKTLIRPQEDQEKAIGFHFGGEMIGTEGIAGNSYTCTARALEKSRVCELRLENLQDVGCPENKLQEVVISILADEIAFNHKLTTSLVRQSSEQRLAAFLLNIFSRLDERLIAGLDFRLTMSRSDIASYLGLASETVSRVLMKLQKLGIINIRNKNVQILDIHALEDLANSG